MQIECPSCGAAYDVPDHIVARTRMMRCARCARDWSPAGAPAPLQDSPAQPPAQVRIPTPVVAPVPPVPAPLPASIQRASRGRKAAVASAWVASIAALVLAGWWSLAWQTRIVHAWPASARLYAALGVGH